MLGRKKLPVEVGKKYDVYISEIGNRGDGIARMDGYVIFVKNVLLREKCLIEITKTFDSFGFGVKCGN